MGMNNNMLITDDTPNAYALRVLLQLQEDGQPASNTSRRRQENMIPSSVIVDNRAVVLGCNIGAGSIDARSVLVNVSAPSVEVKGCMLVNVTSTVPIVGNGGLLYNV